MLLIKKILCHFETIFLIINILYYEINCENCCESNCNEESCKNCGDEYRFFYEDSTCLHCDGISLNEKKYYYKNSDSCQLLQNNDGSHKLIYGKNEVVSSCANSYNIELGDVCYSSPTNNMAVKSGTSSYECVNYFYIENKDGFIYYNCLDSDKNCSTYNDYNVKGTKQCFNCPFNYKYYEISTNNIIICHMSSCPEGKPKIKKELNDYSVIYRCTENCNTGEFAYKKDEITYCLDKCPSEAKYYYTENPTDGISSNECLPSCINGHYSTGDICVTSCGGYITVDLTRNIFSCLNFQNEEEKKCPELYPYYYKSNDNKEYCLKTCKDTKNNYFKITEADVEGVETYLNNSIKINDGIEIIVNECLQQNNGFYIDEISLKWVSDCKKSASGPYHNSNHCKNSCEKYYIFNDLLCIENCPQSGIGYNDYKYLDEETNVCYNNCPSNLGRGFLDVAKEKCQSCNIPKNAELTLGEGFHKKDDNICYSSCSSLDNPDSEIYYYYNNGENICFTGGCGNVYKYKQYNKNICYKSCLDIEDGSYKIEINNICYKEKPTDLCEDYIFFNTSSGINKYILSENAFGECSQQGLYYIKDSQCVKQCSQGDYIILPSDNTLGKCIDNLSLAPIQYIYYNKTKILKTQCDLLEIYGNDNNLKEVDGENCVNECPIGYYEYVSDKKCKQNYDNNYYVIEESNRKKCVSETECQKYKYIPNDADLEKKCVDKCTYQNNGKNFSYYDSHNKCLDNCLSNNDVPNNKFSYKTANDHLPCISECPNDLHYYEDQKICLNDCGEDYYDKNDKKICLKNCGNNEYIHPGNVCSNEKCPTISPFYYEKTITINGDSNIKVKKCVPNCQEYESKFNFYEIDINDVKKCVESCELSYNGRCYDYCPKGLYKSGNKCIPKCEPNIYKEEGNNSICIPSCPQEDKKYLTSFGKCIEECPEGENYISKDGNFHCLTNCGNDFFRKNENNNERTYDIYQCVEDCGTEVYIEGTKECIPDCDGDFYLYEKESNKKICYHLCSLTDKPFSTIISDSNTKKICDTQCNGENKYYGNDKNCSLNCNNLIGNKTINDSNNECISQCDLNSQYKYLQEKGENNNPHCQLACDQDYDRYIMPNYICSKNCKEPNNFVVRNDNNQIECQSKCPSKEQYAQYDQEKKEYYCTTEKCHENSEYKYYYLEDKICLKECKEFTKEDTYICLSSCLSANLFYDDDNKKCVSDCKNLDSKHFAKINGHCDLKCNDDEYYNEDDLICRVKCTTDKKIDDHICRLNCSNSTINKYEDENGICVEKCENSKTGYIYYNIDFGNKCQNNCTNKYIKGNTCVTSCDESEINPSSATENLITKFVDENVCIPSCPLNKKYIVYNPNEEQSESHSLPYKCLTDCPENYGYYSIITNSEFQTTIYACKNECSAYIINMDSKVNAKLCFDDGICTGNNPYFIRDKKNQKQCLTNCPNEKPFYKYDETQNIECYNECPNNYVHMPDIYACIPIADCDTKKIKYKTKECVKDCSINDKIFIKEDIYYCIDNCTVLDNTITGVSTSLLLTYDNKCVYSCPDYSALNSSNICDCINYFFIDKSTQVKQCININNCKDYKGYPINIFDTKECIDYCNGVLSSSGYECYPENHTCLENEQFFILPNGDKICDCIGKFYYYSDDNGNKIKKCLNKDEKCPSPFELLITETNECVKNCEGDYKFQFEKTCVSSCPSSSESDSENKCKCKYKYYIDENNNGICLKENEPCPDKYPLIIDSQEKKQCVSSCIGTGYDYYFNKTCKQNCDISQLEVTTKNDPVAQKYAEKKCKCPKIWYYDEITFEENCYSDSEEIDCDSFTNSKYQKMIYNTKQCISSCPNGYYEFNNYCLEKCEDYTEQNIETKSNKCSCRDYTEYDENNNGNIKCLTLDYCKENSNNYSIIEESKKCYKKQENKKCPNDYPFFFNGKCYSENHCPDKTKGDPYELKCICKYKWYQEGEIVTCLSETSNCPSNYPLLVFSTQECKVSNDLGLIEFNYTLYSNCPENTEKENDKCICIKNKDWYKEQTLDGKLYYFCALSECPDDKPYKVEGNDNKECLSTCGEKKKYRGICYDKCPDLTEVGNNNECILSPVNNDLTFDNLEQTITEKLLDLYKSSDASNIINSNSSQKIVTKDATVEFYGVNKNNKGNKHQNIQSDLSYIDISECMEKIYKSNGMKNDDDIIILKFDINTAPDKFLINPVEYKFIDSGTGKELDASLCEHNSIKISYPLHGLIQRYDNRRKKRNLDYMKIDLTSNNKDSLREKLDKGKEIVEEYDDTDIFNINDKIYSDICIAVEVDGKDLTLQDRINYFYPEMSICENNCTYNHTDYINERIYCDCSFKKEFDFKREYYPTVEIDTDRVKNDQGSNMNIAVLKCIPNLKYKKSLSGNGGFIFMLIIIAIEFILLLIIIILGISSLLNKLKNKMKKEDNEEEDEDVDIEVVSVSNTNQEEKKEKEKETQRKLNVPPKRKENYGMEFIPQEYVFLFFNQNEKGVIKKVERDSVPFKTQYNTRILLEKNKNVNYDNIKPRGPFPGDQNILVIVDNMNDSISDYIYDDENEDNERKNSEQNAINNNNNEGTNKQYEPLSSKINKKNKKRSHNSHKKDDEKYNEKYGQNIKKYKKKIEFSITDYDPSDENYSEIDFDNNENQEKGFIESIKKEQRLLKKNYEIALQNKNSSNFVIMLFTEIIDKIYITKILLFTRKFDILSLQLSVYILCHTLLVILLALFYDVKTIEKIWNNDNYPGLGFYLLYGFLACIIIWIIYKIILCLWSNNDKIKEILKLIHINKKYGINNEKMMEKKYNNLAWKIKLKIIIYSIIEFLLLAFCFIYFVTFCTVYTGTKDKVFKSYGIALIEILIIKIIYGIVLAILRKVSLSKEKKTLYDIVVFMNTYLV